MNILFVAGEFAQNEFETILGGMGKAVFLHANELKKRGNNVKILCGAASTRTWNYNGIEVLGVAVNNSMEVVVNELNKNILYREYLFSKTIDKLHKDWPIDIIQYTGWFGVGLLHNSKIPAVMRVSSYTKEQLNNNYSKEKTRLLCRLEKKAAQNMDYIYAPSKVMANAVQRDVKRPVDVRETPFIPEEMIEDSTVYNTHCAGKRYFLFFGRMTIDKGILVIEKILDRLLVDYPDYLFVFAGPYDRRGNDSVYMHMKKIAGEDGDRVIFTGSLSHQQLFPLIRGAEAILMPSLKDNFPNGCAEAMNLNKIVIGTYDSSLEQFIDDGINGLLSKPGDANDLLNAINRCCNLSAEEKEIIQTNARKRIDALNADVYFAKLEDTFSNVICDSKKKSLCGLKKTMVSKRRMFEIKHKVSNIKQDDIASKNYLQSMLLAQWVRVKQNSKSFTEYFETKGYKSVSIYGMNYVGELLAKELENSNINVKYGIDRDAYSIQSKYALYMPDDLLPDVDAIIITPIYYYYEIRNSLTQKMCCPIISLADVLNEMQYN